MEKENTTEIKAPHTITEIIKGTTAEFSHYKEGNLFYSVEVDGYRYEFPISTIEKNDRVKTFEVPVGEILHQIEINLDNVMSLSSDIGESTFERTYKTITLMRYIRKAIADGTIRWDKL
jgi:hypothetical protein